MRVIYLNEAKAYQEAYPDDSGRVVIPVRNIICGFVDGGMLYAMKDPENEILTPFEVFVMFNDMSVSFIQPNHFQQENRVLQFEGKVFCELKQVFNCALRTYVKSLGEIYGGFVGLRKLSMAYFVGDVPILISRIEIFISGTSMVTNVIPKKPFVLFIYGVERGYKLNSYDAEGYSFKSTATPSEAIQGSDITLRSWYGYSGGYTGIHADEDFLLNYSDIIGTEFEVIDLRTLDYKEEVV